MKELELRKELNRLEWGYYGLVMRDEPEDKERREALAERIAVVREELEKERARRR